MNLAPLMDASPIIQAHTAMAFAAILLTITIFTLPKGSTQHRIMGRTWVLMMAGIALSSFGINELRLVGPFSPIHLISVYVLWNLGSGIQAARAGRIQHHKRTMQSMALFALFVAGAFTFLPGRVMHQVFLGG